MNALEPPDLSDLDDMDEEVDTKLWSLSNPWSGEGEGNMCGAAIGLISSGHDPSLFEVFALGHGGGSNEYT